MADDAAELIRTCRRVRAVLTDTTLLHGSARACAWFLVGFAEIRLRRTRSAIPALREAAALARAAGLDDIADRARANLVFALAFVGDFTAADVLLEESRADATAAWRRTEGRPEEFARAWLCFWRGEVEQAEQHFAASIEAGGAMTSYATMARIWWAALVSTSRDPARRRAAAAELAKVADLTVQGLPLGVYKSVAHALLMVADGRPDVAVEILDAALPGVTDIPSTLVIAAEIYSSVGRADAARACVAALENVDTQPRYATVAAEVVAALLADQEGRSEEAHVRLESALALADPERILRPFARADPRLVSLLAAHAQRGTAHQRLVGAALARHAAREPAAVPTGEELSSRALEVLGYLQTGLSSSEIAAALFISHNTLKTHQRAIYRKLGVGSRRDAVRVTRPLARRP